MEIAEELEEGHRETASQAQEAKAALGQQDPPATEGDCECHALLRF